MMPKNVKSSRRLSTYVLSLIVVLSVLVVSGCGEDTPTGDVSSGPSDTTIPDSTSWEISTLLELDRGITLAPQVEFAHSDNRLFMAWYERNPDGGTHGNRPYRIRYKSFPLDQNGMPDTSDETLETVVEIDDLKGGGGLSLAHDNGVPLIAYSVFKEGVSSDSADYNNQGDVVVAVRDGNDTWRNEIAAFGYVSPERNPLLPDGLAGSDLSLAADGFGNALLSFQFFYEGIDSYNMEYPDLRFISQPINSFNNRNANAVSGDEETVEGNIYFDNGSGLQNFHGGKNTLLVDHEGNLIVVYYADNTTGGSRDDKGLRVARKTGGEWQPPVWIDKGEAMDIVDISAAVKKDGSLFVVYTLKNAPAVSGDETLAYSLRYAEETHVISADDSGGETTSVEWRTGIVNHTSINGRYCTLSLDSDDNPVVAYFDEMNFTGNRFFSRIKISSRSSKGAWAVDVISPEDVGLSNNINPYDISPGAHDSYYVGKYNYLWTDGDDRVNICSYSSITSKVYHFVQKQEGK